MDELVVPVSENELSRTLCLDRDGLAELLARFGMEPPGSVRLIDTTRSANDVRLNYIIDDSFVLRLCNAPDMSERRFEELAGLIERYRSRRLVCPAFVRSINGGFIEKHGKLSAYLSEYAALALASEEELSDPVGLWREVILLTAGFAEEYKNVYLSETPGMYSIFRLSPLDREDGIDEKQQNLNALTALLDGLGEASLSQSLVEKNHAVRTRLLGMNDSLPRCFFQGDENFSNVLLDGEQHFAGLIDFNLAGTEEIVNRLANLACFDFDEALLEQGKAAEAFELAVKGYRQNAELMLSVYNASELEREAMALYAWIVLVSSWQNFCFFKYVLNKTETQSAALKLMEIIADANEAKLAV